MDEKDIPDTEEKSVFLRPAQYYLLAQNTALFNTQVAAGNGNYADGKIYRIAGAVLVKTNQVPKTNITTGLAKYQGDFSLTAGVISTRGAVGTVKLLDLAMESGWDMRRQVTLILAKYAIGTGILRPECAVELKTTT
jgi:protein involved in ribonucleotide reduction